MRQTCACTSVETLRTLFIYNRFYLFFLLFTALFIKCLQSVYPVGAGHKTNIEIQVFSDI